MKYIAAEVTEVNATNGKVNDNEDIHDGEHPIVATDETVNTMVYEDAHTFHAAVRPPPGECDPESDLPCSCPRRVLQNPKRNCQEQHLGPGRLDQRSLQRFCF